MKPDWDKLTKLFKDSATTVIADVDCTEGGKSLCEEVGVQGYPSIKYGDPSDLQDYEGDRDFEGLKKFADGLGPQCSPANIDLCSDEKKAKLKEFMALSQAKRDEMIAEKQGEIAKLEEGFKTFVEGLQKQYTGGTEQKDKDVAAIKESGLGLLKSVHAHIKKTGNTEL
mmetsp:Transcript_39370/g.124957  ORF Transcript_39370/g.124957 Transcript_39370/m.124957 type:complete len:169 (+) Transcript_39370:227-733(+)|eukprot:CAMPEP_0203962812 /NCGR_PEP_ID=MMETSP0359-20131031/92911_1 /ASSEMBLY_ACC=CAM_ASM_000338 /TAXON_ID=268821 /ORGANISM="Scrippsiella Hangoei, Strain SHTV-5" /LENGTH=168 /DNA_ID=CAMNT_0050898317 /DNA_START=224 /DNA_END=730 /DNA_ORIENTATION=-